MTPPPSGPRSALDSPDDSVSGRPADEARRTRRTRLRLAAADRGVPLPTILTTVGVVAGTYLVGVLAYHLRTVLLLIFVAGFLALVLDPFVVQLQVWGLRRRGLA